MRERGTCPESDSIQNINGVKETGTFRHPMSNGVMEKKADVSSRFPCICPSALLSSLQMKS